MPGTPIRKGFETMHALIVGALVLTLSAVTATAGSTWDGLRSEVFGDRQILDGREVIDFQAPDRPLDQRKVPVSISAKFGDGRSVKTIYFIVDENPSPVAATFRMGEGRSQVSLAAKFRFNSETDTRAVIEASDGALYMVAKHTKFAGGQASCSAPPQGDPEVIVANMGRMKLEHLGPANTVSEMRPKTRLSLSHPNHTGMVLDQISLLYVPLKMVRDIEVWQGNDLVFAMTGSITLAQDPTIDFDYRVNGATSLTATARDTDGETWTRTFPIGQGS
jgi:sulfur-oxidizing protein SoxY